MRVTYNVPAGCAAGGCGLIVDVHGGSMDADQEDANTNMRALGARHGYIVAQPTAPPGVMPINNWGWGEGVVNASAAAIFAWVEEALLRFRVDRSRVHFMGFSEGAGMTWRMLCGHADVFASVVVIEGNAGGAGSDCEFTPSMRQIPVLLQSGVYDVPENWAGAQRTVRALTSAWNTTEGTVIAGDDTYNRTRYVSSTGVPFEFIKHTYIADYILLGHCFPGINDTSFVHHTAAEAPFFGPFGCPGALSKRQSSYFIGDEAVDWFVRHPQKSG